MNKRDTSSKMAPGKRRGINILELLLAMAILSVSLYPVVYIFRLARPARQKTHAEYLATLLAHHTMETIVARKLNDKSYLPTMSDPLPIVETSDAVSHVSSYFRGLSSSGDNFNEKSDPELYYSLKQFSSQIDTYYLEGNVFKVIVYVLYEKEGRKMRVFFERLLSRSDDNEIGEFE